MVDKLKKNWEILVLVLISTILVFSWFRYGMMYGGGEAEFPFYYPERLGEIIRFPWQQLGLGRPRHLWSTLVPFSSIVVFLFRLGLSPILIQALFFFCLLFFSSLAVYSISRLLLSNIENNKAVSLGAALFYLLNPYMMMGIWLRFLYQGFFMMLWLPVLFYFFVKGLTEKKIKFALPALLLNFFCAYAYMAPAYIVVQFVPIFFFLIFYLWQHQQNRETLTFTLWYSFIFFISWFLTNLWWLLSFLPVSFSALGAVDTAQGHATGFGSVSPYFKLPYVTRLINSFYLFVRECWGSIYKSFIFQLISWLIPIIASLAVVLKPRRWINWLFFTLALFALFMSKGASFPLGWVMLELMRKFSILGIFRNPYGRWGPLLPFSYAFLFGLGLSNLLLFLKTRIKDRFLPPLIIVIVLFLTLGLYVFPIWKGEVMKCRDFQAWIKVPSYYEEANNWFNLQSDDFRLLHLPLMGHGGRYFWEKIYDGGEPSFWLFQKSSVARSVGVLPKGLLKDLDKAEGVKNIWTMMVLFNARFLVLHHDVDAQPSGVDEPEMIEEVIQSEPYLRKLKQFGKLDVYELDPDLLPGHLYLAEKAVFAESFEKFMERVKNGQYKFGKEVVVIKSQNEEKEFDFEKNIFGQPKFKFYQVNPAKYIIEISDSPGPVFLVFSEAYNPLWRLYHQGEIVGEHLLVNGYANGYYLDKAGDLGLVLEFSPPTLLRQGSLISGLSMVFLSGLVVYDELRKRKMA